MGYDVKATMEKVKALSKKDGKFSTKKFAEFARASASYGSLKVATGVNKKTIMFNICRDLNENMVKPLAEEIVSLHTELIEELSQEIKRLNNVISGSEETAPMNEAEERYESDIKTLEIHIKKIGKLEEQLDRCKRLSAVQNEKLFGSSTAEDDDEDELDMKQMELLEKLEKHGKSIEKQVDDAKHVLFAQASNGLYNKSIKTGTADKAPFPKVTPSMKKKEYIAKVKQFMEYRPEQFSHLLPEARRAMDDLNKRTGVHYDPISWDELGAGSMQEEFKQQNDRLYKLFELHLAQKDFTAAQAQYTYGLSGLNKTNGKCEKGDGLRILHYFLSTLSKVSTGKIQEVETDLQCLPMKFGAGGVNQIRHAVAEAEELLELGDEMECMVQYKTVLQICQVLTRKNPLFIRLHEQYLKATVVAERSNSIADLRKLMGDIKEVCDKISGGGGDETRNVKVNMGMRSFHVYAEEAGRSNSRMSSSEVDSQTVVGDQKYERINSIEKRKWEGGNAYGNGGGGQKQNTNKKAEWGGNRNQEGQTCRKDKCMEKAFHHKKERGGHVHESKLCFECFVDAVRDGKKEKPEGVHLKDGKKMVLKRGEDLRWNFKILAVKMVENHEGPIQKFLKHGRAEDMGEEEMVFHTFMQRNQEDTSHEELVVVEEGKFDLRELGDGEETGFPIMSNTQQ